MRYTLKQFNLDYPDDDSCLEVVFQNQFGDLTHCPKCAAETTFYKVKKRQCYACQWCGYQLHPLAGTIFRKTTTPLKDWFYAIYLFSMAKNGVSAKELERHLGCTYKTAWRMCKQIRLLMAQEAGTFTGTVEIDETYVGGHRKDLRGRGGVGKVAVVGIVERKGEVRAETVQNVSMPTILSLMREFISIDARVHTDEFRSYYRLKALGYDHRTVKHQLKQWTNGDVHTNSIEGFWGQLKLGLNGTFHGVSPKYLQHYVNQFAYMYNHRDEVIFPLLVAKASKLA